MILREHMLPYEEELRRHQRNDILIRGILPYSDSPAAIAYCKNNPIRLIGPDGMEAIDVLQDPPKKKNTTPQVKPVTETNKSTINKISWGETQGLYPTKNTTNPTETEKRDPSQWDTDKVQELLKARAAIALIGSERNADVHSQENKFQTDMEKMLAPYHSEDNFPQVDAAIKDDKSVKFFYLSDKEKVNTPSISSKYWNQECVKTYGPFYNNGGGDTKKGSVYIHFYKAVKKK